MMSFLSIVLDFGSAMFRRSCELAWSAGILACRVNNRVIRLEPSRRGRLLSQLLSIFSDDWFLNLIFRISDIVHACRQRGITQYEFLLITRLDVGDTSNELTNHFQLS